MLRALPTLPPLHRETLETLYRASVLRFSTATVFSPPPERDPSPLQAAVMEPCNGQLQPPRLPSSGLPELPFLRLSIQRRFPSKLLGISAPTIVPLALT